MILYTILPAEQIFAEGAAPQCECVSLDGMILEGVKGPDGLQISRVISTDPAVYLDSRYSPGQVYRQTPGVPPAAK